MSVYRRNDKYLKYDHKKCINLTYTQRRVEFKDQNWDLIEPSTGFKCSLVHFI